MTKKEIKQLFENGETLTMSFGIRKNTFSLGNHRITEKQFDSVKEEYSDKITFTADYGGFTRHFFKYNKQA